MNWWPIAALLLAIPGLAAAQGPQNDLYHFDLQAVDSTKAVEVGGAAIFELIYQDLSRDSTEGISPVPGVPNYGVSQHAVSFAYSPQDEDVRGWAVLLPAPFYSTGGQTREIELVVTASQLATNAYFPFTFTATIQASGGPYRVSVNLTAYSLGLASFNAQVEDIGGELQPDQVTDIRVRLTNGALQPRGFDIQVVENPCNMQAVASTNNLVGPKETKTYTISVRAPADKLWYFSQICSLGVQFNPTDAPSAQRTVTVPVIVNGGYVDPVWVFWLIALIVLIILLILFFIRRKERIEEELLGKPQKPWTIPVEALYLRALRQKDERAWYVVRHHLMEEEYQSSLLWYAAYKKATRGSRKKEALVLRQEKGYERWKAKWMKAIAKPLKQADKFDSKLQRKLDRKARKEDRKDARKVRNITKKMAAAHAKQVEKALEKWQKQAKKAAKKGLAAPERPMLPEPDYPEEPEPRSYVLAEHKWSKKAGRFRARRVREQGNLEVKFEKADARRLAKLRRKVQRLARKLDDPEFVAEHPLLRSEA